MRARSLVLPLALIVVGGALASAVQSDFGRVRIRDVTFPGPNGVFQHARLYVPESASVENPAPGILAIHGYINSHETQSGFAIELSRRGYVVLAADQTGHGYSDPPSGANGYGGPAALAFLRSLDFVDRENVGLEGHSMGGWAVQIAAAAHPDGYRSVVLEGSSTGTAGAPRGTPTAPRNLAVVFSRYDEFSSLMWGSPVAGEIGETEKLRAVFGTEDAVQPDRVYGSIDEGTARVLHQPPVTHPGDHHSRVAIGHAIDWFSRTLSGGRPIPTSDQVWFWKELGTALAALGMVLLLVPVGGLLLGTPWFAELAGPPSAPRAAGFAWWVGAAVFMILPAATLFPFKDLPGRLEIGASRWLPQNVTNQLLAWAIAVGAISLALLVASHWAFARRRGARVDDYGVTWGGRLDARRIGKSWLLAVLVAFAGYATLVASDFLFQTDYRFWVFAIKPPSALHLRIIAGYLLPFTLFFLVLGATLHGQLRRDGGSDRAETARNVVLLVGGFVGLLAVQYVPLFAGGTLADAGEALWTIIAFQFVPIMAIVGVVSTAFHRETGHVYVGSFLSAILVTWIVVASQATHFAF